MVEGQGCCCAAVVSDGDNTWCVGERPDFETEFGWKEWKKGECGERFVGGLDVEG